jgi:predicted nucleic acid-binding protein
MRTRSFFRWPPSSRFEARLRKSPSVGLSGAEALSKWLEGIVSGFADRIHPIDTEIALLAGELLPQCHAGPFRHWFHDALLVATARVHGHGLLTKREGVFGAWTKVKVVSP